MFTAESSKLNTIGIQIDYMNKASKRNMFVSYISFNMTIVTTVQLPIEVYSSKTLFVL